MGGAGQAAGTAVWKAAADAMAWTASMRDHMAWTERRRGWEAKSKADMSMNRAAAECGEAIGAKGGGFDAAAMARAVEATRGAASAMSDAAKAFGLSSRHHMAAKSDQDLAAQAYERAMHYDRRRTMDGRAARSQENAQGTGEMASGARNAAKSLVRNAGVLEARAKQWAANRRRRAVSDLDDLASFHADMLDDARRACQESEAMGGLAADAELLAAEVRGLAASEAEYSTARAAEALEDAPLKPDAKEAVQALNKAAAAASKVAADERRRGENQTA